MKINAAEVFSLDPNKRTTAKKAWPSSNLFSLTGRAYPFIAVAQRRVPQTSCTAEISTCRGPALQQAGALTFELSHILCLSELWHKTLTLHMMTLGSLNRLHVFSEPAQPTIIVGRFLLITSFKKELKDMADKPTCMSIGPPVSHTKEFPAL